MIDRTLAGFVNPYPGLKSFQDTPEDRGVFFGRDEEREALLHLVLSSPQVVLFSRSGLGKTSLIQAGLMQDLRAQGCFPVVARVIADPAAGPVLSVLNTVDEAARRAGVHISGTHDKKSLWGFFRDARCEKDGKPLKAVLILDQFEELFTVVRGEARAEFKRQLADVMRHRVPEDVRRDAEHRLALLDDEEPETEERRELSRLAYGEAVADVKVLLAIREDYLPEIYALVGQVPTIMRNALRLEAFGREQAREAIEKPAHAMRGIEGSAFEFDAGVVEEIVDFLRTTRVEGKLVPGNSIDPFQLQILCRRLNERRHRAGQKIITSRDLGGNRGMQKVTQQYYWDVCRRIPLLRPGWNERGLRFAFTNNWLLFNLPRVAVRRLCEEGLVTFGHRNSLAEKNVAYVYGVGVKDLSKLIHGRLVRGEERFGTRFYEITHDSLLSTLLAARDARRTRRRWLFAVAVAAVIAEPMLSSFVNTKVAELSADKLAVQVADGRLTAVERADAIQKLTMLPVDINLSKKELQGEAGKPLRFSGISSLGGRLNFRDTTLQDVEFRNVDFKRCGAASASGERRPNKPASGERRPNEPAVAEQACADFREARLEKVVFLSAELDDAIFFGVRATHTAFSEVLASRTNFRMAKLRDVAFSRAWLEEAVFDGARIQDAYFQQGSLHRASLRETHLTSVVFRDTDIEGAAFDGSKAVRVSFPGTAWWLAYGWTDEQIAEFRKSYPPFRYATSSGFTAGMQSREDKLRVASPDDRTQAYALNDLAWYRAVRGAQLEKAEHDVDEALRLLPGNRDLLDTKAFIRMQDRDFGAAAALLEQALGLDEGRDPEFRDLLAKANREHLYRYGLCLQHLGRGDAQKFLRAASLKGYVPTYERVLVAPPPRG